MTYPASFAGLVRWLVVLSVVLSMTKPKLIRGSLSFISPAHRIQINRNQSCHQPEACDRGDPEAGGAARGAEGVGQPEQEAAAEAQSPQHRGIDQHRHHRFLVSAQGIYRHGLQRIAQMI